MDLNTLSLLGWRRQTPEEGRNVKTALSREMLRSQKFFCRLAWKTRRIINPIATMLKTMTPVHIIRVTGLRGDAEVWRTMRCVSLANVLWSFAMRMMPVILAPFAGEGWMPLLALFQGVFFASEILIRGQQGL